MTRILVVDDDPRVCDALAEWLAIEGYAVSTVYDGHAALERLRSEAIDLAIVDVNMPGLGGAALVQELRTKPEWAPLAGLPVIVISALWDVVTFDLDVQAGFAKPVRHADLRAKIHELVGPP